MTMCTYRSTLTGRLTEFQSKTVFVLTVDRQTGWCLCRSLSDQLVSDHCGADRMPSGSGSKRFAAVVDHLATGQVRHRTQECTAEPQKDPRYPPVGSRMIIANG